MTIPGFSSVMISRYLDFLHSDSGFPGRMFKKPQWQLQDFL